MSSWPIFQFRTNIVIPHSIWVRGGAENSVKPFRKFSVTDPDLRGKLDALFKEQNVRFVDRFDPETDPRVDDDELRSLLGARSWKQIDSLGRFWTVRLQDARFAVTRWRQRADKVGMEPEPATDADGGMFTLTSLVDFLLGEFDAPQ